MYLDTETNQNLRFLDLDEEQRASFLLRPLPELVRFAKGQCFYKWTEFALVNPAKPKNPITEYWLPWKAFKVGDREVPGFKELRMRYANKGGGVGRPQEFARSRNAVTEQWNAMSSILKVQLQVAVWGFVGLTSSQRAYLEPDNPDKLTNVMLIGGDYQLCIPNLNPHHIRKI
jgi:hypothetical protein